MATRNRNSAARAKRATKPYQEMIQDIHDVLLKIKDRPQEKSYADDFDYSHDNPYHDRLEEFPSFVFRDKEAEQLQGKWNRDYFQREAPLAVEIGSGFGDFLVHYAENYPQHNLIGLDYRFKRSYQVAKKLQALIEKQGVHLSYLRAKGERLGHLFAESEVDDLFLFFPDPWPKKRHFKKRLLQLGFLDVVHRVLRPGGRFWIKTDQTSYYLWMDAIFKLMAEQEKPLFKVIMQTDNLRAEFPDHFLSTFETKFEKIFLNQGVQIKAFVLESLKHVSK